VIFSRQAIRADGEGPWQRAQIIEKEEFDL